MILYRNIENSWELRRCHTRTCQGMLITVDPPFGSSVLSRLLTSFYKLHLIWYLLWHTAIGFTSLHETQNAFSTADGIQIIFTNNDFISRYFTFHYQYRCFMLFHWQWQIVQSCSSHNCLSLQYTYSTSTNHSRQYKDHWNLSPPKSQDKKDIVWSCFFWN